MRTMKKVLAAGLTAVMAMSLMVGCGSKTKETEAATEAQNALDVQNAKKTKDNNN